MFKNISYIIGVAVSLLKKKKSNTIVGEFRNWWNNDKICTKTCDFVCMRGCFIRMGLISNIKSSERSFKGLHIRGTVQKGKKEAWPLGWRVPGPARANARRLPAHNKHCERSPTAVLFLHDKFTLSFLQELGNITILKGRMGGRIIPELPPISCC